MTADEIRQESMRIVKPLVGEKILALEAMAMAQVQFTAEVAAQLAELNEQLHRLTRTAADGKPFFRAG